MDVLSIHPSSAGGAAAAAAELLPEVVVVESWMPDLQGADVAAAVKRSSPDSKVILLSGQHRPDQIEHAISSGADGFLPKSISVEMLAEGIRRAHGGESPVFGKQLDHLVERMSFRHAKSREALARLESLSKRERSVLSWLSMGASTETIAEELFISPTTVKNHVKHILAKTQTSSREELLYLARLAGTVTPAPTTQDFPFTRPQRG